MDEKKIKSGIIYTQNDINLDDQNPPIDIIYLKYDRAETLFDNAAWKLIKEHGKEILCTGAQ